LNKQGVLVFSFEYLTDKSNVCPRWQFQNYSQGDMWKLESLFYL
jgi:hypothetical protein